MRNIVALLFILLASPSFGWIHGTSGGGGASLTFPSTTPSEAVDCDEKTYPPGTVTNIGKTGNLDRFVTTSGTTDAYIIGLLNMAGTDQAQNVPLAQTTYSIPTATRAAGGPWPVNNGFVPFDGPRTAIPTTVLNDTDFINAVDRAIRQLAAATAIVIEKIDDNSAGGDTTLWGTKRYYSVSTSANGLAITYNGNYSGSPGGDVMFGNGVFVGSAVYPMAMRYHTIYHEIGHSFSLRHPWTQNTATNPLFPNCLNNAADRNAVGYSMMPEAGYPGGGQNIDAIAPCSTAGPTYHYVDSYWQNWTPYDLRSIQETSGFGVSCASDTIYTFSNTDGTVSVNGGAKPTPFNGAFGGVGRMGWTIYDSGGVDLINTSNYSTNQVINLNPGTYSWPDVNQVPLVTTGGWVDGIGGTGRYPGSIAVAFQNTANTVYVEAVLTGSGNDSITVSATPPPGNIQYVDGNTGTDTVTLPGNYADWTVSVGTGSSPSGACRFVHATYKTVGLWRIENVTYLGTGGTKALNQSDCTQS